MKMKIDIDLQTRRAIFQCHHPSLWTFIQGIAKDLMQVATCSVFYTRNYFWRKTFSLKAIQGTESACKTRGINVKICYGSHSPNKFLIVLYGDSIVMAYRVTIGDIRCWILHGQVRSSHVLIGWAGLAVA